MILSELQRSLLKYLLTSYSLDDLKKHTVYNNYSEADEVIINFWSVVRSFNQRQREQLLSFATSCPRAPLLGFRE